MIEYPGREVRQAVVVEFTVWISVDCWAGGSTWRERGMRTVTHRWKGTGPYVHLSDAQTNASNRICLDYTVRRFNHLPAHICTAINIGRWTYSF